MANAELERKEFSGEDPLSMYDNPLGEMPAVPIGQFAHVDNNGHI